MSVYFDYARAIGKCPGPSGARILSLKRERKCKKIERIQKKTRNFT